MSKLDRNHLYPWMAILRAKYMGSGRARMLVDHFGSIEKAFKASVDEIIQVKGFSQDIANAIQEAQNGKFDEEIEKEFNWAERNNVNIFLQSDRKYPSPLRHIPAAPAVIYVKGSIKPEDVISLAIVGSRSATDVGKRTANRIANELAEAGLTIVSGLAWGIDASAHKGALKCKTGRTIGVLGNGLKFIYPKEHQSLYEQTFKRGALITELFTSVAPDKRNFPPRNRIISGLTLGTLIVEAPERSGALITAKYALDQGKEVFAIPGSLESEFSKGTNKLIRDTGATLVTSTEDILRELEDIITFYKNELAGKINKVDLPVYHKPDHVRIEIEKEQTEKEPAIEISTQSTEPVEQTKPEPPPEPAEKPKPVEKTKPSDLSEDEDKILQVLTDDPKHIDTICRELEWPISRVSSSIGLLELRGLVERVAGMRFRIL